MKLILLFITSIFFASCVQKEKERLPDQNISRVTAIKTISYDSCKEAILHYRQKNKTGWDSLPKAVKEKIFTKAVTESIIPNWIGTAWDFNGTSEIPKQGSIACGYFVTTILRDAGLNIARIKLAQCPSEQMIHSLVQAKYVHRFSNIVMGDFIRSIQQQGYGLYIVGLDNHTGFIYNDGTEIYFIHSTFVGTRNVQKEKAGLSWVLQKSKYKVLGKISADERILERWIN